MPDRDYRTDPADTQRLSFYVFDNLRCQQDREGGAVFRYDTVQEAAALFRYLQAEHPNWTVALGASLEGTREIDLVQRRNGDNCLITDYQAIDFWKDRPDVRDAVREAMARLGVEWQVDHELAGCSILVPHEFEGHGLDPYFEGRALRPRDPDDVMSSVQEVFAKGEGWVSLPELREMARQTGYGSPEHPKVTRINVAYRVVGKQFSGYVDMSPEDFRHMKAAYLEARRDLDVEASRPVGREETAGRDAARDEARPAGRDEARTQGDRDAGRGSRSIDDAAREAKGRAAQRNLERPERQQSRGRDLEL